MNKPSFYETFLFWLKLGFISFGGPAGQISIMHEYMVERKKWISESKFMHALNYCMLLPGPEAQQLATYIGWMLHGVRGGVVAGLLFILPSVGILLALSVVYILWGKLPFVSAIFDGFKPAVVAIILLSLFKIGKKALVSPFHLITAIAAFVALFFFNISFPIIILTAITISLLMRLFRSKTGSNGTNEKETVDPRESEYAINTLSPIPNSGNTTSRLVIQIGTFALLWAVPLFLFISFSSSSEFWKTLILFFSKSAWVTFGGAYAVLPFVAQVSVEQFHWLSAGEMIDGLALGETTPGPLIMVLAFVGFMAGFNSSQSLFVGTIALLVTVYYTFLPSFFLIFAGAPIIERSHGNSHVKQILSVVTAAVVGVILNLAIYVGKTVLITPDGFDSLGLGWIVLSLVVLTRFKFNMIGWIGISAVFGVVRFAIGSIL